MKTLFPVCTRGNLAVSLVLAISMVGISYGAGGVLPGDGSSESTAYLIEDLADFDVFADPCNSATYWASGVYTKLTCDPNLAGRTYTTAVIAMDMPGVPGQFNGIPFEGIFDGDGHVVKNLIIDTGVVGNNYLGLFGKIEGSSAQVKNLGIENINITCDGGSEYLGGLCGHNNYGTITDCYATGLVTGGTSISIGGIGGLCGSNRYGTITNCYATSSVTGEIMSCKLGGLCGWNSGTISDCYATGSVTGGISSGELGGLCGYNFGTITNCYATGSVTGGVGSAYLGGLCGGNDEGTISNCYATGSVTGGQSLGGLCGCNGNSMSPDGGTITNCYAVGSVIGGLYHLGGLCGDNYYGTITNCYAAGSVSGGDGSQSLGGLCGYNYYGIITNAYATGSVTGDDFLGGLCGWNLFGAITNCFWDTETSGMSTSDGGTGKTTVQMQTESTFTDAGWDFVYETANGTDDIWIMDGYPVFVWQESGYVNVPDIVSMTQAEAEAAITGLGLFVGTVSFSYHDTIPAGVVISQDPQAGVSVPMGSCISFVVSLGIFDSITGSGTESDPYVLDSFADFQEFTNPDNAGTYWDSGVYTRLDCDLDLDPALTGRQIYTTAVIAPDTSTSSGFQGTPFAGIFDGNDHTISNLTIDTAGAGNDYLGLFGWIESYSAEVKNLGIENINITGGDSSRYLGGLCGYNYSGTITNCYATGEVTGNDYLGGLCGYNYYYSGTITNCYATGSVTGGEESWFLGGLCGCNSSGTINNCYAAGSITGGDDSYRLGGLCGSNGGTITNCYATGSVTGDSNLGSLCGLNYYGTITNCYATGSVTGGAGLGGLCGGNDEGTITNCYFYLLSGPDNHLGTALDDLQMQDAVSFMGFDFAGNSNDGDDDYWTIVTGYCPKLTWQTDDGPLPPTSPITTTLTGSGYSYDPFQINSYGDFTEFRTNSRLNCGYYILTTDIDLSSETFTAAVINRYFGGHFEGNGHVISNITIDTTGAENDYLGLFSKISASVSDLDIENINIAGGDGSWRLGGLCGENDQGTITNCYATGTVSGDTCLGGLCGVNYGTITNCYATGIVSGTGDSIGGLCGENGDWGTGGTISNCYATGSVTGGDESDCIGGLCGSMYGSYASITNSYSTGIVRGNDSVGGLCGNNSRNSIMSSYSTGTVIGTGENIGGLCGRVFCGNIINCYSTGQTTGGNYVGSLCGYQGTSGSIRNCYATGSVTGDSYVAGLCGYQSGYEYGSEIINCFWDTETSGMTVGYNQSDDNPGTIWNVVGKTTAQMQTESTFTDAGWDFSVVPVWHMPFEVVGYPMLGWQRDIPGDFTGRYGVNLADFTVLSGAWLSDDTPTANWNEDCDLDGSGVIDTGDLKIFAENWLAGK